MKKYIEPYIEVMEMDTDSDMLNASPNDVETQTLNQFKTADDDLTKRIDFSDSESIW